MSNPADNLRKLADDCRGAAEVYSKSPGLAGHGVNVNTVIDIYERIGMVLDEIASMVSSQPWGSENG